MIKQSQHLPIHFIATSYAGFQLNHRRYSSIELQTPNMNWSKLIHNFDQ